MKIIKSIKNILYLGKAISSHEPNYMVLFVTAVCNARCEFCFYWEEIENAKSKLELQFSEYQKITRHLNHLYYLSVGGGEPFLKKDFHLIIESFYKNSRTRMAAIATHGGYPKKVEYFIKYLHEKCPDLKLKLQVSIDNLFEKHDESRKVEGLFHRLLETCDLIANSKKRGHSIMLTIGTVITPENQADIQKIKSFLDKRVSYDHLSLIYPRGNPKDPSFLKVSLEEYQKAKAVFETNTNRTTFYSEVHQEIQRQAKSGIENFMSKGKEGYPWICNAAGKMVTLFEKGELAPCEILYQADGNNGHIGNVRNHDYNIPLMLDSKKGGEIRKFIKETHCACTYECAALCNVALNKKQWPLILKNAISSRHS